jgi:hypothetical protein
MAIQGPKLGLDLIHRHTGTTKELDLIIVHGENAWPWRNSPTGQVYPHPFTATERQNTQPFFWPRWLCDERGFERVDMLLFSYSGVSSTELYERTNLEEWISGIAESLLHSISMRTSNHGSVKRLPRIG